MSVPQFYSIYWPFFRALPCTVRHLMSLPADSCGFLSSDSATVRHDCPAKDFVFLANGEQHYYDYDYDYYYYYY